MKTQKGAMAGLRWSQMEAKMERWRVRMPVVAGLHHFAQDPDPYQTERSYPDLHQSEMSDPDTHQTEKSEPDLYQNVL